MAQLTVPVVFDHDDLQRMVNEKIAEVKAQFIPKADYENRLKAEKVAMLTDVQLQIEEIEEFTNTVGWELRAKTLEEIKKECSEIIQQKINTLKENIDGE